MILKELHTAKYEVTEIFHKLFIGAVSTEEG
jgi:hypothetical protein